MQQFLDLEQATDFGLTVHHLPLGRDLEFRAVQEDHLVAPKAERFTRLENFVVKLSKQPVTRHKQHPHHYATITTAISRVN
jgi:hypothetical protein